MPCYNYNINHALQWAVENDYLDMVKFAIEEGKKVNRSKDLDFVDEHAQWKEAAFLKACTLGYVDIVEFLVTQGVEIDDKALLEAVKSNQTDIVEFLLSKSKEGIWKALTYAWTKQDTQMIECLIRYGDKTPPCKLK